MNKRTFIALALLLPVLVPHHSLAAADERLRAVEEMGRLNGIALQCRYARQVKKIKLALIAHLPKERQMGRLFEEATNQSFLSSLADADGCPGEDALAAQIEAGIETMKREFLD